MNRRRVQIAAGVAITACGLAATATPQLAGALPGRRIFVQVVGALALVGVLLVGSNRRATAVDRAETGDPERLAAVPVPGDDARDAFDRAGSIRFEGTGERQRKRVAAAAIAVVRRRYDCSETEARSLVASGEWTDDPHAAAFLAGEGGPRPSRIPIREWFRADSAFAYRAGRTVDAIVALAEMEADP